jgi:hypothetical protein
LAPLRKKPVEYTGRVCVSRAKPSAPGGATTPPCASKGYGPKTPLSQSTTSAVRSTLALAASAKSGASSSEYALITCWPSTVVSRVISYCPIARNAR